MKKRYPQLRIASSISEMANRPSPLFHPRPGRVEPYPAYIVIRPSGWFVEAITEICPSRDEIRAVHRGLLLRLPVPAAVSGESLYRFCCSHSIRALMSRVCADWRRTEDAARNVVGKLGDPGIEAMIELQERANRDLKPALPVEQLSFDWQDSPRACRAHGKNSSRQS